MAEEIDLGTPEGVKARKRSALEAERDRIDTLKLFMSAAAGRRYFYSLLADCGIGRDPFALNALAMAHATGKQNIGLRLLADLTRPEIIDLYVQMIKENVDAKVF